MKVKIKICGILDDQTMSTISNMNVDYVGLVFFEKSPRNISIEKAKSIIKYLNNSTKIVALTVNASDQFLRNIVTNLSPDYLQLHGDFRAVTRPWNAYRRRDRNGGVRRPQDGRR